MEVLTAISEKVLIQLNHKNIIFAKTDFNNPYSSKAYLYLKKLSKFDNFFFGIIVNQYDKKQNLKEYCYNSNPSNNILLTLNIPKQELYIHNYYDFTDLIYALEYPKSSLNTRTSEKIIKDIQFTTYNKKELTQVIYPKIKKEWIKNIEQIKPERT